MPTKPGPGRVPGLGAQQIETHLAAVDTASRTAGRVCLIADTVQHAEDRAGHSLDLMYGVTPPPPDAAWDWELAPFREIGRRHRLIHRIHAYPDRRGARA